MGNPLTDEIDDFDDDVEARPHLDVDPAPLPIAPDGGIEPGAYQAPLRPILNASPERFICLRGPCRHYLELAADLDAEAPDGHEPTQFVRACTFGGIETELTNQTVRDCNMWDPISPITRLRRGAARLFYQLTKR